MSEWLIGPVKLFVVLGASPIIGALKSWVEKNGAQFLVVTSPDQEKTIDPSLDRITVETLDDPSLSQAIERFGVPSSDRLGLSLGARWIFKKPFIQNLFCGNLLNAHGARLPIDRGGGGFSWRILRRDRIGALLLHLVDEGVDTGEIIAFENYVVPRACQTPLEMQQDYRARLISFIKKELSPSFQGQVSLACGLQAEHLSAYWPRLNTERHAWIDWSWEPQEIESLILAFDDPYPGARTECRFGTAILKSAQLHGGEHGVHPFQAGIISRHEGTWLVVALSGGLSLIVESVTDEAGNDLVTQMRPGDRFFTPIERLAEAASNRVTVGPLG